MRKDAAEGRRKIALLSQLWAKILKKGEKMRPKAAEKTHF
jgi:hypothetical protein